MITALNSPSDSLLAALSLDALPGPASSGNPTGARTQMLSGRVSFENADYQITVGDDDTVHIMNQRTGEQYLAWGPPQVRVDGDAAFDFYGTTTLELQDGTKVTITTVPWADDPLVTVSERVTITNQHYGVEVLGMSSQVVGDLRFIETMAYGWLLDAVVADGNLVHENANGAGFVGEFGQTTVPGADTPWQLVDQAYIEATDLARLGELAGSRGAAWLSLSSLLSITFVGAFRGVEAFRMSDYANDPRQDARQDDRPRNRRPPRRAHEAAAEAPLQLQLRRAGAAPHWFMPRGPTAGCSGGP